MTNPTVRRVSDDRGSHIEPPLDENASPIEKLRWAAAVAMADAGIEVHVSEIGDGYGLDWVGGDGATVSHSATDYRTCWYRIGAMADGADMVRRAAASTASLAESVRSHLSGLAISDEERASAHAALAGPRPQRAEIDRLARWLIAVWEEVDSRVRASHVATFADMARALLAAAQTAVTTTEASEVVEYRLIVVTAGGEHVDTVRVEPRYPELRAREIHEHLGRGGTYNGQRFTGTRIERRAVTSFADRATPWVPVDTEGGEPE